MLQAEGAVQGAVSHGLAMQQCSSILAGTRGWPAAWDELGMAPGVVTAFPRVVLSESPGPSAVKRDQELSSPPDGPGQCPSGTNSDRSQTGSLVSLKAEKRQKCDREEALRSS